MILKGVQNHPAVNSNRITIVENIVSPDVLFYLNRAIVKDCADTTNDTDSMKVSASRQIELHSRTQGRSNVRMCCYDIVDSFLVAYDSGQWE